MKANKRRRSNRPEALLSCALLASAVSANPSVITPDATAIGINGGGDTLADEVLAGTGGEFALFNSTATKATLGTFWAAGSGPSQNALIYDDLTCDIDAVTGANGGTCVGPDGGTNNTVDYAAAVGKLTSSQISTWATSSFGQAEAGNLIEIPAFGIAPAIVVNDAKITKNGQLELSDNDLCGIYSGLITDFSQITDTTPKPAPGQFKLVYRTDANGLTFLITDHLSAVCSTSNTQAGITFTATQTFATLFPGGINSWIPNAVGESGDAGVANYLSGLSEEVVPQALGYVSTGWTSLYPDSQTALSNGAHSALLVAALENGGVKYQPTIANVIKGLLSPSSVPGNGSNLTPPSNPTDGANPTNWIPLTPLVQTGYPIVGYSEFVLFQCYHSVALSNGVVSFLKDHYAKATYHAIQNANGFVTLSQVTANGFLKAIEDNILADDNSWLTDIHDPVACDGIEGR